MMKRPFFIPLLIALLLRCGAAGGAGPVRWQPYVHNPSTVVRCGGEYRVFATGWGIMSVHSRNLTDWMEGPPVFARAPEWTQRVVPGFNGYLWAPDVVRVGTRWLLYYAVSKFGTNTSAIGLATSATLDPAEPGYGWTDCGVVVESRRGDDFNAIDPAVMLDADGKLWMSFGSFWSGIKLVQLDAATGRRAAGASFYSLARHSSIEAPCICRRGDFYYLFVNWGLCCKGLKSTYNIRVGRSRKITGPYLDKAGRDMMRDGGTLFMDSTGLRIGPGHAGVLADAGREWFSYHFYDATRFGKPTLGIAPLRWDADGWPVAGP
jgi:arabinan endo-1,5-alpha-L-arabinosidase